MPGKRETDGQANKNRVALLHVRCCQLQPSGAQRRFSIRHCISSSQRRVDESIKRPLPATQRTHGGQLVVRVQYKSGGVRRHGPNANTTSFMVAILPA